MARWASLPNPLVAWAAVPDTLARPSSTTRSRWVRRDRRWSRFEPPSLTIGQDQRHWGPAAHIERVAESTEAAGAGTEAGPGLGHAPRLASRTPFPLTRPVDGWRKPTRGARADSGCAGRHRVHAGHPGWRHARFGDAHDSGWEGAEAAIKAGRASEGVSGGRSCDGGLDQRVGTSAAGCGRSRTVPPIRGVHTASGAPRLASRTPFTLTHPIDGVRPPTRDA
jgi:hypothetical protein